MSRRTETAYNAQSSGNSAQHDEAKGLGDRANATLGVSRWSLTCVVKVHVLIWGDLSDVLPSGSARYGNIPGDRAEVRSLKAIVGVEVAIYGMAIGNDPRPTMWRTSLRFHPTEGPNTKNSCTQHEF